jgi:hypothetical protein
MSVSLSHLPFAYYGYNYTSPMFSSRALLEREKRDLLNEMMALPQNAVVRRINELVKRARSVKVSNKMIRC